MIKIKVRGPKIKGAIVVILDSTSRILLLRRPDWVHWAPSKWAFPGGKIEDNESSLDAAIRETKEETNLDVGDLEVLELGLDIPIAAYYTREYTGTVTIDEEHVAWAWVHREELRDYDLAPQVLEMVDWVLKNE
jgi:8-oxo-dGTP diphosphatase